MRRYNGTCPQTERSFYKRLVKRERGGTCVHVRAHVIQHPRLTPPPPPRLVWEKTSPQATVVSMVTGRVEVREEVERTGCSEAARGKRKGREGGRGWWLQTLVVADASSSHSKNSLRRELLRTPRPVVSRPLGSTFCSPVSRLRWQSTLKQLSGISLTGCLFLNSSHVLTHTCS